MVDVILFSLPQSSARFAREVVIKRPDGLGESLAIEADSEAEFRQKLNKWLDKIEEKNGDTEKGD